MAGNKWRLLLVDDDEEICEQVIEGLSGERIAKLDGELKVTTLSSFSAALDTLDEHKFDLLILDVRLGTPGDVEMDETAGIRTLGAIQEKRFLPIIFYTAAPHLVRSLEGPLIRVVEKTEQIPGLLKAVEGVFNTSLPLVNRALIQHLERIQCNYMWNFVAQHWNQLESNSDRTSLTYLLARRLSQSLSRSGIVSLAESMGYRVTDISDEEETVHPMEYYIMPPVSKESLAGDIYKGRIADQEGFWVLLTPSCDMVPYKGNRKAEWVLLARCLFFSQQSEYISWKQSQKGTVPSETKAVVRNNRSKQPDRYRFLPKALDLPDLVVDFQQLVTMNFVELGSSLERKASLDSPFAEALISQFSRYFGRLGTPNLNVDAVISRLE
ncbi:response regulator [Leptolyngbya sp. ST-U4]|uniref:response regulator n=1 Tax=Leptolyngbya sp. ST-U4 TaxID=2933912 RepID=UPI0032994D5C